MTFNVDCLYIIYVHVFLMIVYILAGVICTCHWRVSTTL